MKLTQVRIHATDLGIKLDKFGRFETYHFRFVDDGWYGVKELREIYRMGLHRTHGAPEQACEKPEGAILREVGVFDCRGRKGRCIEIAPPWTMGVLYESQVPTQTDSTRPSFTEGALIVGGEPELFTATYVSNSFL